MPSDWDVIGYVISSDYRKAVLRDLNESRTTVPSEVAERTNIDITLVSRALGDLREKGLVELLVSEDKVKGRIYRITDDGERIWNEISEEEL